MLVTVKNLFPFPRLFFPDKVCGDEKVQLEERNTVIIFQRASYLKPAFHLPARTLAKIG